MKHFYYIIFLFSTFCCFNISNNKKLCLKDQIMEKLLESLPENHEHQTQNDESNIYMEKKRKRYNAEMVNHILRNGDAIHLLNKDDELWNKET